MTAKQAMKKLGGKKKVDAFAAELTTKYGVKVDIVPCVNEECPRDNWLNVLIETPNKLFTLVNSKYQCSALDKATDEVCEFLFNHGLHMTHECGGDGDTGPIDSYRVR